MSKKDSKEQCPNCKGFGHLFNYIGNSPMRTCPKCHGKGKVDKEIQNKPRKLNPYEVHHLANWYKI